MRDIKMTRLEVRKDIQANGHEFFERMYKSDFELSNIAGEFMDLNENYVLLHQGYEETYKTVQILTTGFSINQKRFLTRLEKQVKT